MLNKILKVISYASLVLLVVPSFMYLSGKIELDAVKNIMLISTVIWFCSEGYYSYKSTE